MPTVPTFALYGEQDVAPFSDWLHCESIASRSGRYDWEIRPHRHTRFFQILYLRGGRGECLIEGRTEPLAPISVVTVPPGAVHGFRFSPDVEGWVLTLMAEKAAEAMTAAAELQDPFGSPRRITLPDGQPEQAIAASIGLIARELTERKPGRDTLVEAHLTSLLVLLARVQADAPAGETRSSALARHADQFRRLLNGAFRTEHSVAFYARQLGVSETHLNRVCRAVTARSALGVIHERIVAEASRDLAFTTLSVQEIGRSLGFEDPAYFSRFFSKAAGVSPKGFRRQAAARDRG